MHFYYLPKEVKMARNCPISSHVVLSVFEMYCNASLFVDATVHTIDERCPILKLFAKLENPIFQNTST